MAQSLSSAAEHASLTNSAARAEMIRDAVRWLAEHKAEVKALNAKINEFMVKTVKGDLGFKLADFNAVYRVSQLEIEDRDQLLECVREGFAALHIGGIVDWVAAADSAARRRGNGHAKPDEGARTAGHQDGLGGVMYHAAHYPQGEPGHDDYQLGLADGQAERERVMALGQDDVADALYGGDEPVAPRRRGRPPGSRNRPKPQPEDAGAEF